MDKPLFRKYETPNFQNLADQKAFMDGLKNGNDLIQNELSVNKSEQNLLNKRLDMVKDLINSLPASDPQYSMLLQQMHMDQIELDELKARAEALNSKLL